MHRHTRPVLMGMIIIAALLSVGRTSVGACSCAGRGGAPCQSVWNSEAVFVATVVSVGPAVAGDRLIGTVLVGWSERAVTLKVTEAFRGVEPGNLTVRTAASSASCGFKFEVARAYVVFAERDKSSGNWTVSYCSSTAPVEESAAELAYLRGPFRVPSDSGVVSGVVSHFDQYDWVDHPAPSTPFAGAELRLEGYAQAYTTTSGTDGSYVFRVPAGEYRLFVQVRDGVYAWPGPEGSPISLKDNRGCAIAHVAVRPDNRVEGRLVDAADRPVPFMSVHLIRESSTSEPWMDRTVVRTDERGHFEFRHFDPGSYVLGVAAPGEADNAPDRALWISPTGNGTPAKIEVQPEQRRNVGDVRLPSGVGTVALSGVVVDEAGRAIDGAVVQFMSGTERPEVAQAELTTGQRGQFNVSLIAGRSYRMLGYWRAPGSPPRLFSATPVTFEAVGELKPFRLVLTNRR